MISSRNVYQKKPDGSYYKSALIYQQLKNEGKAKFIMTKRKHIFLFNIKE